MTPMISRQLNLIDLEMKKIACSNHLPQTTVVNRETDPAKLRGPPIEMTWTLRRISLNLFLYV
eukprot:6201311-Pleurochrysis_carterae.AAC.2